MIKYLIRRLLQNIPILFGITLISFFIIHLAPGSPIGLTLNPKASPKIIEQMEKNYDLDKPIVVQYVLWVKKLCTGDLHSFKDGKPVLEKIAERIPATLLLNVVAMVIIFSVAIPLGVFSATRRYSWFDNLTTFGAYLGISIPSFWLAYLLILATVKCFGHPILGMRSFGMEESGVIAFVLDHLWHLMLPSLILAVGGIAAISRYMRSSMLEVIQQDYIRTARAKGIPEDDVYYRHALRNALLPIVTIFGFLVPSLISGSVIIETVFAWPGIGRLAYQAVLSRDYSLVMTILTLSSALTLIGNMLADVLYGVVDPRIRY
ncbi:MAG: ABC transporter permease [Proteobacteria bacterium]|nr:ABC transporter permease [Pseudomonadota bacterium]